MPHPRQMTMRPPERRPNPPKMISAVLTQGNANTMQQAAFQPALNQPCRWRMFGEASLGLVPRVEPADKSMRQRKNDSRFRGRSDEYDSSRVEWLLSPSPQSRRGDIRASPQRLQLGPGDIL